MKIMHYEYFSLSLFSYQPRRVYRGGEITWYEQNFTKFELKKPGISSNTSNFCSSPSRFQNFFIKCPTQYAVKKTAFKNLLSAKEIKGVYK